DGVFYIRGGTQHGVAVEFGDHVVVVEGPLNEQRSLAVDRGIEEVDSNKPIRYLVNIPSWTAATDPNRAPRAGLCVLRTACRVGSRLSFCAPWRDALPGWSRSSPRIAISAASDPSVDTPDTGAWAMTEAPDTRNGVRTHHPLRYYTCSEHPSRSRFRSQSGPLPAYPPESEPYWMAAKKTLLLRPVWFHSANNKNTEAEPQHLPCTVVWHNPF